MISPYKSPSPSWKLITIVISITFFIAISFYSLDLKLAALFEHASWLQAHEFLSGFVPPKLTAPFIYKILSAAYETLAMSMIGTLLAAIFGLLLALPASLRQPVLFRQVTRLLLNGLRSIPELVWAAILLIAAGLGPFPGTLALALHTSGVLGRLFADSIENLPPEPARALQQNGASESSVFLYATLPLLVPQMVSYTLYRWENNIRAAAVLGVVGAGGLGQMLYYHLSLFQTHHAATVILAMAGLIVLVDSLSYSLRQYLTR